jgi:carboxyl-terminal processing protease
MRKLGIRDLCLVLFCLLLSLAAFAAGFVGAGKDFVPEPVRLAALPVPPDDTMALSAPPRDSSGEVQLSPVEAYYRALSVIQRSYYGKNGEGVTLDSKRLTYAAIKGMLASLNDRYTRFLEPDEFRRMEEENRGEFGGIGARLEKVKDRILIKDVLKNTPAQRAGLKPGDTILAVDGVSIAGMSIYKAVDLIRGERGTIVKLTILRKGFSKPKVISVKRDLIRPEVIQAKMLEGNIAYIKLTAFNQTSDQELDRALAEMERRNMQGLILDLRDNPGGLLSEAVAVASRFVKEGPVVIIQERGGRRRQYNVLPGKHNHKPVPLVVLVNKWSASASEIVAGAIKDTGAGLVVGTETWGKGLVQTINPIPEDGSAVLVTTHRYFTPRGTDINHKGIQPDVRVELTEKDIETMNDRQLKEAIAILNGQRFGSPVKRVQAQKG